MDWPALVEALGAMDWEKLLGTLGAIAASAFALFKFGARQKALREQIRGDLELIEELQKNSVLRQQTGTIAWLHGKVVVDVAKLARVPLGTRKRPIQWGSLSFAVIVALGFGWWTYDISKDGFAWPSLLTGLVAALFALSATGMLMNRQVAPDDALPAGAVAVRSDSAEEQVAGLVALAAMAQDDRFADDGAAGTALKVFELLQLGLYEDALAYADSLWLECRIRSWLWNNVISGDIAPTENLDSLLEVMLSKRKSHPLWQQFVESESNQFESAWEDLGTVGAGSTRRRMARDIDMVILAPVGNSEGYYVSNATVLPKSVILLMRATESGWKLLNHGGFAAPVADWPPVWWMVNDPAIGTEAPALELS